jgi:hypothetical protein
MFDLEEIKHLRRQTILPLKTKPKKPAFNTSNLA